MLCIIILFELYTARLQFSLESEFDISTKDRIKFSWHLLWFSFSFSGQVGLELKLNFLLKSSENQFIQKNLDRISVQDLSPPPHHSIPLLSVLHQNKALHIFRKRGQRSIFELNKGCCFKILSSCNLFLSLQEMLNLENRKITEVINCKFFRNI